MPENFIYLQSTKIKSIEIHLNYNNLNDHNINYEYLINTIKYLP